MREIAQIIRQADEDREDKLDLHNALCLMVRAFSKAALTQLQEDSLLEARRTLKKIGGPDELA